VQRSTHARNLATLGGTLALGSALVAVLAGAGQATPQRPVFRAGATFVSVDAYPRRDGKVVEGLTAADFQILEDGKPQNVESFEFIRISPVTPDDERRDPNTPAEGNRQAADPHNRVFVIYLDLFHTSVVGSYHSRQTVLPFLMRAIGPTDLFGVMTPEVPIAQLTFARRTETIDAELAKYWTWGEAERLSSEPRNPVEQRYHYCGLLPKYRDDLTMTHLEALTTRLGNLRDERKNILFISESWLPNRGAGLGKSPSQYPSIPTVGVGPGGKLGIGANMSGSMDRAWCLSEAGRLGSIDSEQRLRDLLRQAQRANVAFYPVDVGGLRTGMLPASVGIPAGVDPLAVAEQYREDMMERLEVLQTMASATDGTAIVNTNDLSGAVRKVADDLSAFYLLGYYSSNTAADGRFRRIEVKVKATGTEVSARRGYMAPSAAMRKAEEEAAAKPVAGPTPVDLEMARLGRIRPEARMYSAAALSATSMALVVEIAAREAEGGRWKNGGAVSVTVSPLEAGAAPVSVDGRIEPAARGVLLNVPLAGAGGWRVRTRVTGDGDDIDDSIDVAAYASSLVGEPTVFRATPSPRAPLRPVADYQFRRTERVHVEWPVARALDGRTARLLSRRGDALPVPVALTERADGDRTVLAADVQLAALAEGDYVIEIVATQGSEKVQRLLAFRVVR
jgi:VWFA-related protein